MSETNTQPFRCHFNIESGQRRQGHTRALVGLQQRTHAGVSFVMVRFLCQLHGLVRNRSPHGHRAR